LIVFLPLDDPMFLGTDLRKIAWTQDGKELRASASFDTAAALALVHEHLARHRK
jgi:hypothetical protein